MTAKRQPSEKDYITNKVLSVFSVCLVGVLGLMMLYRVMSIMSTWMIGVRIAQAVCGVGVLVLVLGLVKLLQERKQGRDMRFRLVSGRNIAFLGAAIAAVMLVILLLGAESIKLFYLLLPAVAVYYLIFHSYPREFFIVSVDCGVSAALLWIVRAALDSTNYKALAWVAVVVAIVLAAVQTAMTMRIKKTGCIGLVDGRRAQLFASAHAYLIMHVTAGVMAAFVVLGAVLGAQIAFYLIFAAFGYLFVSAVYYTVKNL